MRGVGTQRANKSKVTFSEKDEVEEYNPADPAAAAPPAENPTASSAPMRGRPPKPVEDLTPLEQAEKRMKTAVHKYQEEKFALLKKVGDLKGELAWMDHPSTVARLDERLDKRCRALIELEEESEAATAAWEAERALERVEVAERWLAGVEREEALLLELIEVKEARHALQEQLEEEREAHSAGMHEAQRKVVHHLSERVKELEYSCGKARVRDLWLRGII
jgi:hypothetical protein